MTLRDISKGKTKERNDEIVSLLFKSRLSVKDVALRYHLTPSAVRQIIFRINHKNKPIKSNKM